MSATGTDAMLLERFRRDGSAEAFRELVARHTDLVFGCAVQRLRDAHAAADVTQAVFLALALKAKTLKPATPLAGWLFTATRFTCAKYQRGEQRRKEREMHAAEQQLTEQPDHRDAAWAAVEPHLAAGLDSLSSNDREAVLLRFYGNATHGDVAVALRITEEAAKKRVNRALEKLRRFFTNRGVTLSVTAVGGLLAANAAQAAPTGLAETASQTALAGFSGTLATTKILMLAKGALKMMFYSQLKLAAAIVATTVVVTGTSVVIAQKATAPTNPPTLNPPAPGTGAPPATGSSPKPGMHLFAPRMLARLKLSADQQKQIANLETEFLAKLEKLFTPEQFQQWRQKKEIQLAELDAGLNLTADEQAQFADLGRQYRAELLTELKEVLTPEQFQRCKQNEEKHLPFIAGLNLTANQWKQVSNLQREKNAAMKSKLESILTLEHFQQWEATHNLTAGLNLTAEQQQQVADMDTETIAKLEKLLTPEQLLQLE